VTDKADSLQKALHALEVVFAAKLPSKLLEIETAFNQVVKQPTDKGALSLLHRLLHTMAGSAGTFGFDEVGMQARELEARLKSPLAGMSWRHADFQQFSDDLLSYLEQSARAPKMKARNEAMKEARKAAAESGVNELELRSKLVFLVDSDPAQTEAMRVQLEHFGYEVVCVNQLDQLMPALHTQTPEVLVVDLLFPEGRQAGADAIEKLRRSQKLKSAVIYTSNTSSFDSRLRAVRAHGDGFFTKPVDVIALSERIEALVAHMQPKAYRILVLDDDQAMGKYHAAILQNVGMQVQVLDEPNNVIAAINTFQPELILMDVYMPGCNGVELTKLIRQDISYLNVPIVFLSSETDLSKQLEAVKVGADDFLCKPIPSDFLVSAISTRAERYRALRVLITRDGLTGLYNHTAIKEELMAEIAIAGRNRVSLALAMIDLDDFKHVNDTYGHTVGDQVLRALSGVLKQRLRRGDVIGRYDGEKFIVIFPATTAVVAKKVLDQIRVAFKKIKQFSESGVFSVTFSAGIADLELTTNLEELIETADSGLYIAKHAGKNCVVVADE
jgi:diguanylate cyclase (GGDEF)-like protein